MSRWMRRWRCHGSFVCCYKVDEPTCQSPWETHRYGGYFHDMDNHFESPNEVPWPEVPWWDQPILLAYCITHDPAEVAAAFGDLWDAGRDRLISGMDSLTKKLEAVEKKRALAPSGVTETTFYATRANFLADPQRKCICGLAHKPGHCDGGR